jgi:hypothetical protein
MGSQIEPNDEFQSNEMQLTMLKKIETLKEKRKRRFHIELGDAKQTIHSNSKTADLLYIMGFIKNNSPP